jgi:hypothetical protein
MSSPPCSVKNKRSNTTPLGQKTITFLLLLCENHTIIFGSGHRTTCVIVSDALSLSLSQKLDSFTAATSPAKKSAVFDDETGWRLSSEIPFFIILLSSCFSMQTKLTLHGNFLLSTSPAFCISCASTARAIKLHTSVIGKKFYHPSFLCGFFLFRHLPPPRLF